MPKELLISRWQEKRNPAILMILIAGPVGMAIGLARSWGKSGTYPLTTALAMLAFYGFLVWMLLRIQTALRRRRIVIDPTKETVGFEYFPFLTSFWPEKARPHEEIRFHEIVEATYKPPQGKAPGQLVVRTTKGRVSIPETMEHFGSIQPLLEEMAAANAARPAEHLRNLALEPSVATPWYGWLFLIVPIAGILWLCWKVFSGR